METVDLLNVPIFSTGKWEGKGSASGGDEINHQFLDSLVTTFEQVGARVKPRMVLTHDKEKSKSVTGMASLGWITSLRHVAGTLYADIKNVPKKISQIIDAKAFGRFSPGIWRRMSINGVEYTNVFEHLALLGADLPANTDLDSFIDLYYAHTEYEIDNFVRYENKTQDIQTMSDEIKKPEVDYSAKIQELDGKLAEFSKALSEKDSAIEKLAKENAELKAQVDGAEHRVYMKDVDKYIDDQIVAGKVLPSQKPALMALCSEVGNEKTFAYVDGSEKKEVKGNNFDLLKSFIANQPKIIPTGEQSQFEAVKKTEKPEDEVLHDKAIAYQKDHSGVTYRDALVIVSREA